MKEIEPFLTVEHSTNEHAVRVLLSQYEKCWEDRRNFENMIWQTPTISLAIVGVVIASAVITLGPTASSTAQLLPNLVIIMIASLFSFGICLVATIQLRKQRFYSVARTADIDRLASYIARYVPDTQRIPFRTKEILAYPTLYDVQRGWIDHQSAYRWLFGLMVVVTVGLALITSITGLLAFKALLG